MGRHGDISFFVSAVPLIMLLMMMEIRGWVGEHERGGVEGNAVLFEIGARLGSIPFEQFVQPYVAPGIIG
jgi:hypothetical protein